MPKSFIVTPLAPEDVDCAFPVAQALHPGMTAPEWRSMARQYLMSGGDRAPDRRGIMVCRMGSGHIRGLFCYALDADRVLNVRSFVAIGLFDAPVTAGALIDAIDLIAHQLGARTVEVDARACVASSPEPELDARALFEDLGYVRDGDLLYRSVKVELEPHPYPVPVGHA